MQSDSRQITDSRLHCGYMLTAPSNNQLQTPRSISQFLTETRSNYMYEVFLRKAEIEEYSSVLQFLCS